MQKEEKEEEEENEEEEEEWALPLLLPVWEFLRNMSVPGSSSSDHFILQG